RGMTRMYSEFYSFPFLVFRSDPDIYLIAGGVSVIAAILGALKAASSAFALPAAVAMRPPAPQIYKQFLGGAVQRLGIFSQLTTMALRHLIRHPLRSGLTAVGIAFSVALMSVSMGTIDSIEGMIDAVFFRTERQDATLAFGAAQPPSALSAVRRLPGVIAAEPFLVAPVTISNGHYSRELQITGKPPEADITRVLDLDFQPIRLPETGLALGDRVADILSVDVGDVVRVEFLDGKRRV